MVSYTFLISVAAALASVGSAAPLEVEERQIGPQIANYDNLNTPTVVSLTSVGTYQGLNYSGIALASNRISTFAGVPPHSPPNDIFYSTLSTLIPLGGPPQISIPTSSVGLFTPSSIYFGCTALVPVACSFTVTGSRAGSQTAQQTFQFNPSTYPAPLQKAVLSLPGFVGVDKIEFTSAYSVFGISVPGATVMDDFAYIITAV